MAKQFLIDLGVAQKFFKHKHLRELFIEECIPPGLRDVQDTFRSWPDHYIDWRWGTLVEVILRFKTARTTIQYLFDDAVMQARFDKLVADSEKKRNRLQPQSRQVQIRTRRLSGPKRMRVASRTSN